MNDKEILIAIFKRRNIEYRENEKMIEVLGHYLAIEAEYIEFTSKLTFDSDGNILNIKAGR